MKIIIAACIVFLGDFTTSFVIHSVPTVHVPRRRPITHLHMSQEKVVYQKVIKPRMNANEAMFLPSLINYIQSSFELPKDLPMIYKSTIPENEQEDETSSETKNTYSILSLNSPLSRDSLSTKMDVEIVGIYTDSDNKSEARLPSMAMVVVKKLNEPSDTNSIITNRLFEDSEKKIIRALDRGLDDFMDGKFDSVDLQEDEDWSEGEWTGIENLSDYEGLEEASLEDIILASKGISSNNDLNDDNSSDIIVDTVASDVPESTRQPEPSEVAPKEEFAVAAAKAIAAKRKGNKTDVKPIEGEEEFAVAAAKAVAAKLKNDANRIQSSDLNERNIRSKENTPKPISKSTTSSTPSSVMGSQMPMELPTVGASPMLQNLSSGKSRGFQVKISSPGSFKKRSKIFEDAINSKSRSSTGKNYSTKQRNVNVVLDDSVDSSKLSEEERQKTLDSVLSSNVIKAPDIKPETKSKTDAEIEQDIVKAAMDLMPGSDNSPEDDLTSEELLKQILKFGDEKEKENADGTNFVRSAFSKADNLLKEERKLKFKEPVKNTNPLSELKYEEDVEKPLTAEEELKRIFSAGEKIAEGRNQDVIIGKQKKSVVTDEYIDDLISSDETVSRNARSLDDELSELEIRIAKRPGEDSEAYGPYDMFDIFSGPEVYNPNVDPEKSVNWPGARSGTRTDVRLPPSLSEAIKSAKFAASLLSRIVEEDDDAEQKTFYIDGKKMSQEQIQKLQQCVDEGVAVGLITDPIQFLREKSRLKMLVDELVKQPPERFGEIATFYKDLLLSDNFVILLKDYLRTMGNDYLNMQRAGIESKEFDERQTSERNVLQNLVKYAQLLLKETQALGAELEGSQIEIIRSICNVAMDPKHSTDEETAEALTDAVRDLKPLLDENFVAYLKFAIAEERARLARNGVLDDPEHNRWLFVLEIVQEGVYAELSVGIRRYIDHITYVLRMKTKKERKQLLSRLIDDMPSMDIRPFVKVVDNIAASLGQGAKGEFDLAILGNMTNEILQLRKDVHELLPPERIKEMSKEADEWAARQKEKLMKQRGISQQRLKSAIETREYDDEFRHKGEIERFTS